VCWNHNFCRTHKFTFLDYKQYCHTKYIKYVHGRDSGSNFWFVIRIKWWYRIQGQYLGRILGQN
jgi:hypothetical protein